MTATEPIHVATPDQGCRDIAFRELHDLALDHLLNGAYSLAGDIAQAHWSRHGAAERTHHE